MTRRPMLDEIERRPDCSARWRRVTAAQEAAGRLPVLSGPGCWCELAYGHDWPGKAAGAAHPRAPAQKPGRL